MNNLNEQHEMTNRSPTQDANEVLRTYWANDEGTIPVPVDPIAIAHKLGIKVYTADLEANVSGMLFMWADKDPEVYLSGSDSYARQRFTCAHEIGHWRKRIAEGVLDEQHVDLRGTLASQGTEPSEIYANRFAAELLMPEVEIRKLVDAGYGTVAIADKLRVSVDAAAFRLKNLKIIA